MSINWLNYLLLVESLLGIHRHYCTRTKIMKSLIKLQILIQSLLHTVLLIFEVYLLLGSRDFSEMKLMFAFFAVLTCFNSVSSPVTGLCFSHDFTSFYESITSIFQYFNADDQFVHSLSKVFCIGISFNFIFFAVATFRTLQALVIFLPSYSMLNLIPIMISQAVIRFTIIFENFMLFAVTMIVVHLFKSLTSLISAVQERMRRSDEEYIIRKEKIQEWVELYKDLANCCDKVSICFGRQYSISLVLTLSQYILLTYQIFYEYFYICNKCDSTRIDGAKIMIVILSYISLLMMPLTAGQMASKQRVRFYRELVRLYNTMIIDSDEVEVKLLKDFIRLIKKNPIEIQLLFKIPVGVYMLPVILSLGVNYVIVMLQFNHII